jgi:hypothetical protein
LTAKFLREIQEALDFLGQKWYESLKTVASNSSALGFAVEHMTISWISMYGFSKLKNGITQENQSPLPEIALISTNINRTPQQFSRPGRRHGIRSSTVNVNASP